MGLTVSLRHAHVAFGLLIASLSGAVSAAASMPELGTAEGRCRAGEAGPAIAVDVKGLKDRTGYLRLELYPPDQADFLTDDAKLIAAGKTFRRVLATVPASGDVRLCIRAPKPGTYALALIHDRDGQRGFSIWHDGVGVPGNPQTLHGSPSAEQAHIEVGEGVAHSTIVMDYMHGVFAFGPIGH
jgi:uncharacterized protein (DUF2141 family)